MLMSTGNLGRPIDYILSSISSKIFLTNYRGFCIFGLKCFNFVIKKVTGCNLMTPVSEPEFFMAQLS